MHRNILVIADKDLDQHAAMDKARAIATDESTHISVLGFVAPTPGHETTAAIQKDEALQAAIDEVFANRTEVHYEVVVTDDIAGYCKKYCASHDIDLVIKTGNRSETMFYAPVDWQLIRQVKSPVLITTLQKWRARHNVLLTLDIGSDNAAQQKLNIKTAKWAQQWAATYDCELHVAYCIVVQEALTELDIVSRDEVMMKKEGEMRAKLEEFLREHGIEHSGIRIKAGTPDREIPSMANKIKADLVVIGSIGRKGIKGALLGNTAEQTLRRLRTDIAVIHPD